MGIFMLNGIPYGDGEGGSSESSSWNDLKNKPFESIGNGLSVDEEGKLNAEGEAIPDNIAYLGEETIPSTPTPRDADLLGGQEPSYYKDANTLEGHPSSYFAKASDIIINYKEQNVSTNGMTTIFNRLMQSLGINQKKTFLVAVNAVENDMVCVNALIRFGGGGCFSEVLSTNTVSITATESGLIISSSVAGMNHWDFSAIMIS